MDTRRIRYRQGMPFYSVTFPPREADGIVIEDLQIQQLIDYVNSHKIESAYICHINSFDFLHQCNGLKYLAVELQVMPRYYSTLEKKKSSLVKRYDTSPFYELKGLKGLSIMDLEMPFIVSKFKIDLSRFPELEQYNGMYNYVENLGKAKGLKTLWTDSYNKESLSELSGLEKLDTFFLCLSKIRTLEGCENWKNMQCMYLHYNRSLNDISALRAVKNSLRSLTIWNCNKITDFSVLEELQELQKLELMGNEIPTINFIKRMKNLKTFVFDINILDGDLSPCLDLESAYCRRERKHYNLKNRDLPKSEHVVLGNEGTDRWRRVE